MQLQCQLVHADAGQRVVVVSAWRDGACLGSSIGEALTAEEAEDRAIARLFRRLREPSRPVPAANPPPPPEPITAEPPSPEPITAQPAGAEPGTAEPPADPDDWSDELAEVDLQLQRLQWSRDQEAIYLERAFGHPSRSRLVRYADLVAYLNALRRLPDGSDPERVPPPLRRPMLIEQSDQLLRQLQWGPAEGRALLEREYGVTSRQQLSDEQLLGFNMLLESALIDPRPGQN
jgi:hypothetical protein